MKRVIAMYFSPTGTSKKITGAIAEGFRRQEAGWTLEHIDLTKPEAREQQYQFEKEDVLVLGYPVYAGRVPDLIQPVIKAISGSNTPAVIAAVYGNRAYEDALLEGQDILLENGCTVIGAAAFIGEHSYSRLVAAGRPDKDDLDLAADFGKQAFAKWQTRESQPLTIKGNRPYKDGMPSMPFTPKTTDACNDCGICVQTCPTGAISAEDPRSINNQCILCSACIKGCPQEAKYLDAEPIAKIKAMLESKCLKRQEPEIFL